jgi:hypothetical protein
MIYALGSSSRIVGVTSFALYALTIGLVLCVVERYTC